MDNQILLIDDDLDILETYEESLKLSGYDVISSTSAQHGIELYESNHPCMVFSDVKMPEMDGYELFSKIHQLDPSAKVILVTGHENEEKSIIAKKNGLIDVIKKPIEPQALSMLIKDNNC